jgi:CheY-specific phosphatase CheX
MKAKIKKALEETTISTFEDICFMYAVPELKNVQKNLKPEAASEIKYRGEYAGKLVVEASGGLFSAIAENMLSNDNPTLQQQKDALKEIASIICGNIVTCLGGGKGEYKIASPRFLDATETKKERQKNKPLSAITLNFNEGRVDVKVFVDDYPDIREKKQ